MTLADLLAHPERFADLDPATQRELYTEAAILEATLRAVLLSSPKVLSLPPPRSPAPLRFAQAAEVLGLSQSYVRRHWREHPQWGGFEDVDGVVKFPRAAIEQNAANLDGRRPRPRRV